MGGNVIPPEYLVPLDADQLNSSIPISVPYLITPSNQFIPAQATSDGKLVVEATFSGSITIGEIGAPDKSSFTYGTTLEQTIGGVYQDTSPTLSLGQQGAVRLTEYRAFHVNLRDSSGNEIESSSGSLDVNITNPTIAVTQSGTWNLNNITGTISLPTNAAQETGGNLESINAGIETLNSLVPSVYDYIALSYTSGNLSTAVYKHGGAGGTVVSTLTLTYDGSNNLLTVTKS